MPTLSHGRYYNFMDWDRAVNNAGGGTDQASLFNDAVRFCHGEGLHLVIPPGRYRGTTEFNCDNLDGVVIEGSPGAIGPQGRAGSPGTELFYDGADRDAAFSFDRIDGAHVSGIRFSWNGGFTGYGVRIDGSGDAATITEWHRCRFGAEDDAVLTGSAEAALRVVRAYRTYVHGCTFAGAHNGVYGPFSHWTDSDWANSLQLSSCSFWALGNHATQQGWALVNMPDGTTVTNPWVSCRRNVVGGQLANGQPNFMKSLPQSAQTGTNWDFHSAGCTVNGGWIGDLDNATNVDAGSFEGAYTGLVVAGMSIRTNAYPVLLAEGRVEGVNFQGCAKAGTGPLFDFDTNWTSNLFVATNRVSDSNRITALGNSPDRDDNTSETFKNNRIPNGSFWHELGGPNAGDLLARDNGVTDTVAAA